MATEIYFVVKAFILEATAIGSGVAHGCADGTVDVLEDAARRPVTSSESAKA